MTEKPLRYEEDPDGIDDSALLEQAVEESRRIREFLDRDDDDDEVSDAAGPTEGMRLTLHRGDDDEAEDMEAKDVESESVESTDDEVTDSGDDDDTWPWNDESPVTHDENGEAARVRSEDGSASVPELDDAPDDADEFTVALGETRDQPPATSAAGRGPDPRRTEFDHSSTEDVVLLRPASDEPVASASAAERTGDSVPADDLARQGVRQRGMTPKRIGSGRLVPARLTWKPGDPFGDGDRRSVGPFRWDVMLTSASITAAAGLICIWLLRTLLA